MEGKKPNMEAAKQKRNQAKAKMNEASKIFKKMDSFGGKPTQREQQVRKDLQTAEEILGEGTADLKAFKKALKEAKKELKEAEAKPSAQVVVADSCEITGKCECIPCGTAKPKNFPSGVCAPKSATCSAKSPGNPGCYTNCARSCDCAKRAPVPKKCECIPCGTATPKAFNSGACGPASATCSATSPANPGCYTKCESNCDCATRTCK
jgi:hypothetical protein